MNTVYLRQFVLGLVFILAACDNNPPASVKKSESIMPVTAPAVEAPQALKLNVNEAILEALKTSADKPMLFSDLVNLKIKPVKDEQRLSVSGKLLLQEAWQENYLDNIDGGKVELQLWFDG